MREIRSSGSVRGVWRNPYPYRDYDFVGGDSHSSHQSKTQRMSTPFSLNSEPV
jgi:muconolactone delta-isomerase